MERNIYQKYFIFKKLVYFRIWQTCLTMFWSLFGLSEPDMIELDPYKNDLTETFGTLLFACYHISSIIVLLNMLVASMTLSYEKILVNFCY